MNRNKIRELARGLKEWGSKATVTPAPLPIFSLGILLGEDGGHVECPGLEVIAALPAGPVHPFNRLAATGKTAQFALG